MKEHKIKRFVVAGAGITVIVLTILTIVCLIYFNIQMSSVYNLEKEQYEEYDNHFAFIVNDIQDSFWNEVFEGANMKGLENNAYVDAFGEDLAVAYTKEERLQMAIAAKVDGIMIEADDSSELKDLIDEAVEAGIPVITMMTDCYGSNRQSYVGLGSYNLGREFGRQIIRIATKETKKVMIVMEAEGDSNTQNIIYSGVLETLSNEGNHLQIEVETKTVSNSGTFSSEEAIRNIFMQKEELPDIIVCLDEENTINTYRALVDYNMVGEVDIIGYFTSDEVINAINRNVVAATIAVDTELLGASCVDALEEYLTTGHVSDYVTLDVTAVTKHNIGEYLDEETVE